MSDPKTIEPFRLAMRVEGTWWVAYLAERETMVGAIEVARIRLNAAKGSQRVTDGFKALMRDVLESALRDLGATVASWKEEAAPESERAGRA